jgi:hypothetical protein
VADISFSEEHDLIQLVVAARDAHMALEAAICAMLSAGATDANPQAQPARSVPFHGEGRDLAGLLLDMAADLEAQLEIHGGGSLDVTVDGVLRNTEGGYVGWGYIHSSFDVEPGDALLRLVEAPVVETDASGAVVIRATLHRR